MSNAIYTKQYNTIIIKSNEEVYMDRIMRKENVFLVNLTGKSGFLMQKVDTINETSSKMCNFAAMQAV